MKVSDVSISVSATAIELEGPLPRPLELPGDTVSVAQQEISGVDQHPIARPRFNLEAPVRGRGEGILDRLDLVGIVRAGAVPIVRLDQKHSRSNAPCLENVGAAQLPAIEPHRIAAQPRGERHLIEELGVPAVDLPVELALRLGPIQIEEADELYHAARLGLDRRDLIVPRYRDRVERRRNAQDHRR